MGLPPERFAVSPDGRFILAVYSWVAVPGRPTSYQVAQVDTVTNAVTRRTDLPGNWNFWQSALVISPTAPPLTLPPTDSGFCPRRR